MEKVVVMKLFYSLVQKLFCSVVLSKCLVTHFFFRFIDRLT